MVQLSRSIRVIGKEVKAVQTRHLLCITAKNQFALSCFHSPLLTASRLISFPAGTKTLQFPAYCHPYGFIVKSHSGISGSKAACASPEHIVACHALHHHYEPSHPPNSLFTLYLCMVSSITMIREKN